MNYSEYLAKLVQASKYNTGTVDGYRAVLQDTKDTLTKLKSFEKVSAILFAVIKHDFRSVVQEYDGNTAKLAKDLMIPVSSFYNWVQGTRQPPQYLLQLIGYAIIQSFLVKERV